MSKSEFLGLSIIESIDMKCADCNVKLANIVITESNDSRVERGKPPQKSKFRIINCYKCGGSSFDSKILEGSTNILSNKSDVDLNVIDTDILNDNTIYTVLETIKKE